MRRAGKSAEINTENGAEENASDHKEVLVSALARSGRLRAAMRFLFRSEEEIASFQGLRIEPVLASHRNPVPEDPFLLGRERFGGAEDVPVISLLRSAVDQTLRAYAYSFPQLLDWVGKTPISPHGSMALSVARWGHVDWDYVRDIDIRIFLPPELGHLSGFKTDLSKTLTSELIKHGLYSMPLGKDEQGRPQIQFRDAKSNAIHGFHLFLVGMKPGFVRAHLHRDGGYSPHYAYFPEGSMDDHLERAHMQWADVIRRQTEDYMDMFNQLSFNIFGEDAGRAGRFKTPGWYLRKAFKWYATLARMRGLSALEEDLLYQFDHFQKSEEEFAYLARYRYYARLEPNPLRMLDLHRDLARVDSLLYAAARSPKNSFVGKTLNLDSRDITILEPAPANFSAPAWKLCEKKCAPLLRKVAGVRRPPRICFADHLHAPAFALLDSGAKLILIPSDWSLVFTDSFARRVVRNAKDEGRSVAQKNIEQALAAVLASLIYQALSTATARDK